MNLLTERGLALLAEEACYTTKDLDSGGLDTCDVTGDSSSS